MSHIKSLVSIITPAYNSEKFILDTINSVRSQTYKNWELIIIDDKSQDRTEEIVGKITKIDKRIKLLTNSINEGAAVSRNRGLEEAKGQFISFLDSDDIWLDNKLDTQISFMRKHNYPISFTSYMLVNENGEFMNKVIKSVPSIGYKGLLKNTIIGMSTSMINRNIVDENFSFINIRSRQDYYLWLSLLKRGHIAYGIDEVTVKYRVRSNSISSNKIKGAKKVWDIYYKIEKLGMLKSSYYFVFYVFNAFKKRL